MDSETPHVDVWSVSKHYGTSTVLDRVNLKVAPGALVTLLGPSGCGKTTLLRAIAGLITPDEGKISIASRDVTLVPPHKRNVGVVFQNYALFPHLTVGGNVGFGLSSRKLGREEIAAKVHRALDLVQLGHLAYRPISALSGGQQQRVALARAMAVEPDIILFDEALSALDRNLRESMQVELRRLLKEIGTTSLFVTHDQDEALTMSDKIAVMKGGKIEQYADPVSIYSKPETLFTMRFVGLSTELRGTVTSQSGGQVKVETLHGPMVVHGAQNSGSPVVIATRPEHIRIAGVGKPFEGTENVLQGKVLQITFHGSRTRVAVDVSHGSSLMVEVNGIGGLPPVGDAVQLQWAPETSFAYNDAAAA